MQSQNTENLISKVPEILDIQSTMQTEDNTNKLFSSISTETKIKEGSEMTDNSFITALTETTENVFLAKDSEISSLDSISDTTETNIKEATEIINNQLPITLQKIAEKKPFLPMEKEITINQRRSTLSTGTSYNTIWNQSNNKNSELLDTTDSSKDYEPLDTPKAESESKPDNKRRSSLSTVMSYNTAFDQSKNDKFNKSRNDMNLGTDTQSDKSLANVRENIIEKHNEEEKISALNDKYNKGLFVRNDSIVTESEIVHYDFTMAHDESIKTSNDSILLAIQNNSNDSDVCMFENSEISCMENASLEKFCISKSIEKSSTDESCDITQSSYCEDDMFLEDLIRLSSNESINETKDSDELIRELMIETRDLEDLRISRNKNVFIVEETPIKKEHTFYKNREASVVEISSDSAEGTSYNSARSKNSPKLENSPISESNESEREQISSGLQRQAEVIKVSRDDEFKEFSQSEETQHNTDGIQRNTSDKCNKREHFSTKSSGLEKTDKSLTYENSLEASPEQCNNKIEEPGFEKTTNETPGLTKNKYISSLRLSHQESPGHENNKSILSPKNSPTFKKNIMSYQSPAFGRNRNILSYQDSPGFGTYAPLNANRCRNIFDKNESLIEFERNERLCSGNISVNNYIESPISNTNNFFRDFKNESLGILNLSTKNLEHTMFLNETRALSPNKSKNYSPRVNLIKGVFARKKHELIHLLEEDIEDDPSEEIKNAGVQMYNIPAADNVENKQNQSLEYSLRDEHEGNYSEAAEQKFKPTEHDLKYSLEDEREGGYEEKHLYNLKHSLTQDGFMGINELENSECVERSKYEYLSDQHNVSPESAERYKFNDTLEEIEMALKYGLDYKMPTENDAISHSASLTSKQRIDNGGNRYVERYESNRGDARRHFDSMDNFNKSISNEQINLKYGSNSVLSLDNEGTRHDGKYGLNDVKYGFVETNLNKFINVTCRRDKLKKFPAMQIKPISGLPVKNQSARKREKPKMHSTLTLNKFRHIVSPISVYCNKPGKPVEFKKPTTPLLNRFKKNHLRFNKIQSPVAHYIKNTPTAPLQQSNKTSGGANKQLFRPTKISNPISSSTSTKENVVNLPHVIYRPAAKAMISMEKEVKLPHKIQKMIPLKTDIMKHQGRLVKHIDEQEVVERKLTDDLTIANDCLDCSGVSSSDVSILTSKKALIKKK